MGMEQQIHTEIVHNGYLLQKIVDILQENQVRATEKSGMFYRANETIINLSKIESIFQKGVYIYFIIPGTDGERYVRTFETPEQAEAEYKRLAEVMTK